MEGGEWVEGGWMVGGWWVGGWKVGDDVGGSGSIVGKWVRVRASQQAMLVAVSLV